jgi:DNA invertase Pin-like site-specific DNA recombinase
MSSKKKPDQILRVFVYARVSTAEQAERDLSIPAQIDAMKKYTSQRGYEIVGSYVEPGASGTDDNRKIFRRMMEDVLAPSAKIDAILVYQTSRFMRNATKSRVLKGELKKHGIRVIAICQETGDDPMGRIIEGIFELIDQYESEVNGMRTAAAMRENARQGYFNGSRPPFGFRVEKSTIGGRERGRLVPFVDEVETVREVFRQYIAGGGAKGAAGDLNRRNLLYRDAKLWTKDLVLKVVGEQAAIGTYYWPKRDLKNGRPYDDDEQILIPVEPILDRDLFDLAQQVRVERDPEKHPGREPSSPLLLAGLVKCGKCGSSYQLESSGKAGPDGENAPYRYYQCRSFCRTGREKCGGHRIRTNVLEQAVLEHVADKLFTEDRCKAILRDIVEETGLLREKTQDQRRLLQRELDDVEKRISRWQHAFEDGTLPVDVGADRLRALKTRRDELAEAAAKVIPLRPPPPHLYTAATIARFRETVRTIFREGTETARLYLRFLVDEIVVNENHVEIRGRTDAVARMMAAAPPSPASLTTPAPFLATGVDWLTFVDTYRTLLMAPPYEIRRLFDEMRALQPTG